MRPFNHCTLACVFAVQVVPVLSVSAATFSLSPTADAFISSANATNNYGGAGSLQVSAPGLAKGEFQALIQFDLSSAKANFDSVLGAGQWTVGSASLQLTAANPNNALFNTSAAGHIAVSWLHNDAWTEGAGTPTSPGATGVTWNALTALISASDESVGSINISGATLGNVTMPITVTAGVIADITTGGLLSLRMFAPAGETSVSGLFNSRSFNTVASRPAITIEAVLIPEPRTLLLALSGFGTIPWFVKCRSSKRDCR